ncbi:MAG: hypothetical protein WC717_05590 [Candidatus Micrarchaeia archaeon]
MSNVKVFANNVKTAAQKAREIFYNIKSGHDDFAYRLALTSRLPPLAAVAVSRERIGQKQVTRYNYGGSA